MQDSGGRQKKRSWIKRFLGIDVPEAPSGRAPGTIDPEIFNLGQNFGGLLRQSTYADLPAPARAKLRQPVEAALDARDADGATEAIKTFRAAVRQAGIDQVAWQQAAPRLATVRQQVVELTDWADPAAVGFANRLDAIERDAEQGDFAVALQGLGIIEKPVADTHVKAKAKAGYLSARAAFKGKEDAARAALATDVIGTALRQAEADFDAAANAVQAQVATENWGAAQATLAALEAACDAPVVARKAYDDAKAQYHQDSAGLKEKAVAAISNRDKSSEFAGVAAKIPDSFNAAMDAGKAKDYLAAIPLLNTVKSLIAEVDALKQALPAKVLAANQLKDEIDALSASDLKAKPAKQKVEMLRTLLTADIKGDPPSDIRKAQHKLYQAMDMDPAFVEREMDFYDKVADDLATDPLIKEMTPTKWTTETDQAGKLAIIRKIVKLQSEKLGFEPPEVVPIDKPSQGGLTTNGYFSPSDGKIYINFNAASSVKNFAKAVDLAIHENAHNWQDRLVKKFNAGEIPESDPNYTQAMMFAVNELGGAYVKGAESFAVYKKQPMEDHSHMTGPHTASALMAKLNKV